ncbi:chromosome segregation DNA-binding protein [Amylibacter marinus]|uniref:Chromosome segregation DNA-binding protein n=1 Tax=Amylibacter marinus TaxID=1475483 RepID=A0ABQ5VWG4_9RHOB|nr:ParB/RepB/Spo0J family partition protein [Amylibacter marinus]GLQ35522.1 chromosome segregation DNA-binding protein [Amylibacter marinus]
MAKKSKQKQGLGRGLSALMADIETPAVSTTSARREGAIGDRKIPIEKITANPDQPRRDFDQDDLDDLSASIASRGVIQPIIVRPSPLNEGEFQIVAGERRWRAAQQAQLHEVPVVIREMNDQELLEVAIIENVQRADLNAVEEALGYRALMDSFGHTQEQVSSALGKSRSYIANILRLLNLPAEVQGFVRAGHLSVGHARTVIGHEDALALARIMIQKNLSVREAEKLVKQGLATKTSPKTVRHEKDADTRAIESDLSAQLRMKVSIDHKVGGEAGKVTISYDDLEQLDQLCSILSSNR